MQVQLEEELSKLEIDISKAEARFHLSKRQLQEAMGDYCKAIANHEAPTKLVTLQKSVDFISTQLQGNLMYLDWHYAERSQINELQRRAVPALSDNERRQRIVSWIEHVNDSRSIE
jgi:hypothetical protein